MVLPRLPRRIATIPQRLQQVAVVQRVHALPESFVTIRLELPFVGQSPERAVFPGGVVTIDVLDDGRFEDEERSVNPNVLPRLLVEPCDGITRQLQSTESARGMHGCHGRQPPVRMVKLHQPMQIDICQTVTPRQQKCLAIEVRSQTLDATAGVGVCARFDELHPPRFRDLLRCRDLTPAAINRQMTGHQLRFNEETADHITAVTQSDCKVIKAGGQKVAHDVPENRLSADLDHRLGDVAGQFGQS